jgi:hypothetical protein
VADNCGRPMRGRELGTQRHGLDRARGAYPRTWFGGAPGHDLRTLPRARIFDVGLGDTAATSNSSAEAADFQDRRRAIRMRAHAAFNELPLTGQKLKVHTNRWSGCAEPARFIAWGCCSSYEQ